MDLHKHVSGDGETAEENKIEIIFFKEIVRWSSYEGDR
jgi:hypothetical protein